MRKAWIVLALTLLAAPAFAADPPQTEEPALLAPELYSTEPALCPAPPPALPNEPAPTFFFDVAAPEPEACNPPECGAGAPPPGCPGCCFQKCCIC